MKYRVFATPADVNAANARWMAARTAANVSDTINGQAIDPDVTQRWDTGRVMLSGEIACLVPTQWATEFGGSERELNDNDFPPPPTFDLVTVGPMPVMPVPDGPPIE